MDTIELVLAVAVAIFVLIGIGSLVISRRASRNEQSRRFPDTDWGRFFDHERD
jgi:hypothetical protein